MVEVAVIQCDIFVGTSLQHPMTMMMMTMMRMMVVGVNDANVGNRAVHVYYGDKSQSRIHRAIVQFRLMVVVVSWQRTKMVSKLKVSTGNYSLYGTQ